MRKSDFSKLTAYAALATALGGILSVLAPQNSFASFTALKIRVRTFCIAGWLSLSPRPSPAGGPIRKNL